MAIPRKPMNSGALLDMGKCPDCKQPWQMYESEKQWWEKLKESRESQGLTFTMPKRCPKCREKKRQMDLEQGKISSSLRALAKQIMDGDIDDSNVVSQRLQEAADKVEGLERRLLGKEEA